MLEEKIKKWDETKDIALAHEICEELVEFVKEEDTYVDAEDLISSVAFWGRDKKLNDPKAQGSK